MSVLTEIPGSSCPSPVPRVCEQNAYPSGPIYMKHSLLCLWENIISGINKKCQYYGRSVLKIPTANENNASVTNAGYHEMMDVVDQQQSRLANGRWVTDSHCSASKAYSVHRWQDSSWGRLTYLWAGYMCKWQTVLNYLLSSTRLTNCNRVVGPGKLGYLSRKRREPPSYSDLLSTDVVS